VGVVILEITMVFLSSTARKSWYRGPTFDFTSDGGSDSGLWDFCCRIHIFSPRKNKAFSKLRKKMYR
jgi:hypothetical protein